MSHEICIENNNGITLAHLQIGSTLIGPGLQSPATVLFNRPISGILPRFNKSLSFYCYERGYYDMLKTRLDRTVKNSDTLKEYALISVWSVVVVQIEDAGPLRHGMITSHSDSGHGGRSYKTNIMKKAE